MISLDDFHALTLDDKPMFDKVYNLFPPVHSDYMFTTMIGWRPYANYQIAVVDDHIVISTSIQDNVRFRPPLGSPDKTLLLEVLDLALHHGGVDTPFGMIDSQQQQWITKIFSDISLQQHRDFYDYVYLSKDLATLEGGEYAKIRNRLNKFTRKVSYDVEVLTKDNLDEAKEFLKRWCLWKDCASHPFLKYEHQAVLFCMNNFLKLGLSGVCIRIHDKVEAVAVYEPMNADTVVVHFEKGSPEYDGIYKAINWETAKLVEKKYMFINRESDMGEPGLRKAKLSYRPDHFVTVAHSKREEIKKVLER